MEGRRRVTLYDQMKAGDTSSSRNSLASFLNDVVSNNQNQKSRNHTLLDVIQEDDESNDTNTTTKDRKSWKGFKDMLRLKRRNSDESTRELEQQNDVVCEETADNSDQTILAAVAGGGESSIEEETRQVSMSLMDLLEETEVDLDPRSDDDDFEYQKQEEEEREEGGVVDDSVEHNCCVCMVRHKTADNSDQTILAAVAGGGESSIEEETRQVSMSLMDLLEETEVDLDPRSDDDDFEYQKQEEEEREEGGVVDDSVEHNCCVCMVRHKGAAFIPCGHTFCRMCSREIWVSRGNCPLCNNLILEILDLF